MNEKWDNIKDQLLKLQLPQEGIDTLTFLSPIEWYIENYKGILKINWILRKVL